MNMIKQITHKREPMGMLHFSRIKYREVRVATNKETKEKVAIKRFNDEEQYKYGVRGNNKR